MNKQTYDGNFLVKSKPFFVHVINGIAIVEVDTVLWCFPDFVETNEFQINQFVDAAGKTIRGMDSSNFIDLCMHYWLRGTGDEAETGRELMNHFLRAALGNIGGTDATE
ncbi:MAG: hypothetical protein PVJ39_04615 [Gammaproteobacteria bacterium]|jgi:hypothetical protein